MAWTERSTSCRAVELIKIKIAIPTVQSTRARILTDGAGISAFVPRCILIPGRIHIGVLGDPQSAVMTFSDLSDLIVTGCRRIDHRRNAGSCNNLKDHLLEIGLITPCRILVKFPDQADHHLADPVKDRVNVEVCFGDCIAAGNIMVDANSLTERHSLFDRSDTIRVGVTGTLRRLDDGEITRNLRKIKTSLITGNINTIQCHEYSFHPLLPVSARRRAFISLYIFETSDFDIFFFGEFLTPNISISVIRRLRCHVSHGCAGIPAENIQ